MPPFKAPVVWCEKGMFSVKAVTCMTLEAMHLNDISCQENHWVCPQTTLIGVPHTPS